VSAKLDARAWQARETKFQDSLRAEIRELASVMPSHGARKA
jgi:hypothetical protein